MVRGRLGRENPNSLASRTGNRGVLSSDCRRMRSGSVDVRGGGLNSLKSSVVVVVEGCRRPDGLLSGLDGGVLKGDNDLLDGC